MYTYQIKPERIETIEASRQSTKWYPSFTTTIAATRAEAIQNDKDEKAAVRIYSDGSGHEGGIGAAAVLYRNGTQTQTAKYHLRSAKHHTVYEGEGAGLILGMSLLQAIRGRIGRVFLGIDNQAAITATTSIRPNPSHYLFDIFHEQYAAAKRKHPQMRLAICWTPGHEDIAGNEEADKEAKLAAEGQSTAIEKLPVPFRTPLPHSKSAVKQQYHKKLKKLAIRRWSASPRYARMQQIDNCLPLNKFRKTVTPLHRKQASILIQLRTGHVPLAQHLHKIGKAESAECPCCRGPAENVFHYVMRCPVHKVARAKMMQTAKRGRRHATLAELLSNREMLPSLFRFIAQTDRFRSVFGPIPYAEEATH